MGKNKRYSYEFGCNGGIVILYGRRIVGRVFDRDVALAERIVRNLNAEEDARVG